MSQYLMITQNPPTRLQWSLRGEHEDNIIMLHQGKPFKAIGIDITPDHQKILFDPSKVYENCLSYWVHRGNNRILCQCPEEKTEVDLDTVHSIDVRSTKGEFIHYYLRAPRPKDFLRFFLFRLGIYLKPENY